MGEEVEQAMGGPHLARLLTELDWSLPGSIIGNSRVKLTNVADCVKRGLVKEGEDPQKV